VAEQWQRGRRSSDSGDKRGGAQQCAAQVASMCPRGDARRVPGLENRRRSEPGDGCLAAAAGARAPASRLLG
jgi:hypothetical protein